MVMLRASWGRDIYYLSGRDSMRAKKKTKQEVNKYRNKQRLMKSLSTFVLFPSIPTSAAGLQDFLNQIWKRPALKTSLSRASQDTCFLLLFFLTPAQN